MPRRRKTPVAPYNTGNPNQTAPNQSYGERGKQDEALKVVPIQSRQSAQPPDPQQAAPDWEQILAAAKGSPSPGGGLLNQPTSRPDEPITAGLSTGAGPGPEVLGPSNPDLATLRAYLPMLELLANQPNASVSTRNWVRRLRGATPI